MTASYPPRHAQPGATGPRTIKMPASRFSIIPNLRGFEVVDFDGRTVDEHPTRSGAEDIRDDLNEAAAAGSTALARTIGTLHRRDDALDYYDESEDA